MKPFWISDYLPMYRLFTARELALRILQDIRDTTGLPAACGIGTNLYLAKIALDITAKHNSDFIGYLDEETYRRTLWDHRPLTDFWRIGPGIASGCRPWESPQWASLPIWTKSFFIKPSALTQNISSTIPGEGNPPPSRKSKPINQKTPLQRPGAVSEYNYEEGLSSSRKWWICSVLTWWIRALSRIPFSFAGYSGYRKNPPRTPPLTVTTNSITCHHFKAFSSQSRK